MCWLSLLAVPALAVAALETIAVTKGDAKVRLALEELQDQSIEYPDTQHARLSFKVPFHNIGVQQGLVIDAEARLQPRGPRYSDLQPQVRLLNPQVPRSDGYWEAYIVYAGKKAMVEVQIWLTAQDIRSAVSQIGDFKVDLLYKYYCRTPLKYCRTEIALNVADFQEIPFKPTPAVATAPSRKPVAPQATVIPIPTHLLMPGEDVLSVVTKYTQDIAKPGDIIALAESPVAIMQGRLAYCEDIQPRYLARRLNWLFGMNSSLSSVYALEMAFREVGVTRIALGLAAAIVGKLTGKPGEFYRVTGRKVAVIDDCTGTLPPFDKHVVLCPARPQQLCDEIRQHTGIDATIVDANDLGKVDVLAISDPTRVAEVVEALKPNPQGNAGEMTPIVLIRGQENR